MFKFALGTLGSILFSNPLSVRLRLTYKCNYKCQMCGIHELRRDGEMSLEELEAVARNLKKIGTNQIVLTGGEPLLRRDIIDIIRLFRRHGFVIRIQTNGGPHATEDLLTRCYNSGLDDIGVSIDTLDSEKQDRICGAKDVLKNAVRVLKYCADNFSRRGIVAGNVVISKQNFFELPELVKYINSLGAFFNPCIFTKRLSCFLKEGKEACDDDFTLTRFNTEDVERTFREIHGLIRKNYKILISTRMLNDLKNYMLTGECAWRCKAGLLSFDVATTGELAPCCDTMDAAFEQPVANLKDKDFLKQYKGREFQKKCEFWRKDCPGCLYGCYRDSQYLVTDPRVMLEILYKSVRFKKIFK